MRNSKARQDWRHQPFPPTFGEAPYANDDAPGSLLAVAGDPTRHPSADAAIRHRLARLARETGQANEAFFPNEAEDRGPHDDAWADDFQNEFLPANDAPERQPSGPERKAMPAVSGLTGSKRLIATCGFLGTVAGGLVALSLPARYDATAEFQFAASASPFAGMEDRLRVVTSGIVLNKVVDKLGLADDPAFNGAETDGGVVSLARSLLLRSDGAAASDAGHRHALAANRLAESLSVGPGNGPSAIAVTAATGDGETSALIANTVAETSLSTMAAMHAGPQDGAAGATDEAAKKLEVFLAQHGLASGDATAAADALLKLDDQLAAARARTAELNGKIAAMKAMGAEAAVGGGLPREFESNAMDALRAQYLAIKRESDRAGAQLGPRNPERIALDTQLAGARDRIAAELRRIVASLQDTLKEAVQAEQGLAARLARTSLDADDMATLRALRGEAGQAAAKAGPDGADGARDAVDGAGIVTRAYAPLEPSGPLRLPITLAGLLAGLVAGAGIGAARGRRRPGSLDEAGHEGEPASGPGMDHDAVAPAPDVESLISAVRRALPAQDPIDAGGADLMPTESAETPYPLEDTMYPVYADQMHPFPPRQPGDGQQQQFQPPVYVPPHPYGAQPAMPQPLAQPYVYTPYAPAYLWQPQPPMPAGFYPYPQPGQTMNPYPQPARAEAAPATTTAAADQISLEEIRASLREFREAVRELAESRSRRRYF